MAALLFRPFLGIQRVCVWDEEYGIKMIELVLIGIRVHRKTITNPLDCCLLTDEGLLRTGQVFLIRYLIFKSNLTCRRRKVYESEYYIGLHRVRRSQLYYKKKQAQQS